MPFCALQLRQIAPEYYNTLYAHTSWCWVLWRFLVDPSMGPWSRMHRVIREGTPAGNTKFVSSRCSTAALSTPQDAARSAEVRSARLPCAPGGQVSEECRGGTRGPYAALARTAGRP